MTDILLTTFVVAGGVLALIAFHSCWLLAKRKRVITWVYPVLVAIVVGVCINGVVSIQGYPIDSKPTGKWEYLTHTDDGVAAVVTLKEGSGIRVYRFVPTEQEKKKMASAKEAKDKGQRPMLNIDQPIPEMELIRIDQENPK